MAEIGLAAAQTLLATLEFLSLKENCVIWDYKSQLQDLKKTVMTINNVLEDAQSKVLSKEAQGYIEDLKDAVYEADDLFDEVTTRYELKELEGSVMSKHGGEFFQKVRNFFSSDQNQVSQAYRMFHKVKKIQKKLNSIVVDHKKFALGVDYKPICMRGEETCSYIDVKGIIGRDNDKKVVIDKLLESKNQGVSFVTIVGVGGLGKTALAQLVYNDRELKQEFGKSMFWVCISDQDKMQFDVKTILCKILESVMGQRSFDAYTMESLQKQIQESLGRKYFLVLDDVWNEEREKWADLQKFLMLGQGGSRILITTRSEMTATIIGDGWTYRLQGLSPLDSWHLFEMAAFNKGSKQQVVNQAEMVDIGNKIVERCSNIPLAIKVVGSLLFGQDINKWRSFEKSGLAQIHNGENKIMDVLKLSYHNLQSPLKSCFSYCAVFPKDFVLERRMLIRLWTAQGYIVPLHGGQTLEDAGEEYFSILLRRCFFQDVQKDEYDDVMSVKIHDLMHDVAQEVGRGEIQVVSSVGNVIGDRTRHVSMVDVTCLQSSSDWTKLRSLIRTRQSARPPLLTESLRNFQVVDSCKTLRVLDLKYVDGGSLLNSIGKLHHLRYLDLSGHPFEELPNSITKLHNLQTLILHDCHELRQLPHDFSNFGKLRCLDVNGCKGLVCMPLGLDKLTSLRELTYFVAGQKKILEKECNDELKDLITLTNLTGAIDIFIGRRYKNVEVMKDMGGGYLSRMKHLREVRISINTESVEAESMLEKLEPHPNIKGLVLSWYKGTTIPWRGTAMDNWAISLPSLVNIKIEFCRNLVFLPSFSKLPHLKALELVNLYELEYMEKRDSTSSSADEATDTIFFPSLENLNIQSLEKLKGWFWEEGLADVDYGLSFRVKFQFPCLATLNICNCPILRSFPPCPSVKDIRLDQVNKTPQLMKKMMAKGEEHRELIVGNHTSPSSCLTTLYIPANKELESLSEFENLFKSCALSLRELRIEYCTHLTTLSGGLEHLTSLESLVVKGSSTLNFSEDDDQDIMPWKPLHQSLRSLTFQTLQNMKSLPKGMQYLTSLQTLHLQYCENLKGLPDWISCLSSLQSLSIYSCNSIESLPDGIQKLTSLRNLRIIRCNNRLVERCREPCGKDWPKIKHIPKIKLYGNGVLVETQDLSLKQGVLSVGNGTSSSCLATLCIRGDEKLECLSDFESVLEDCAGNLKLSLASI